MSLFEVMDIYDISVPNQQDLTPSPLNGAKFLTLVNDNYKTKNKERKVVPASKICVLVNTKFQNFEVELTQFWKKKMDLT